MVWLSRRRLFPRRQDVTDVTYVCLSVLSSPHYSTTSHANWWLATSVMLIKIIWALHTSVAPNNLKGIKVLSLTNNWVKHTCVEPTSKGLT